MFDFFRNSSKVKKNMPVEHIDISEDLGVKIQQKRELMREHISIHGYVTVVKNQGRSDEQVLCLNKKNLLTTDGIDQIHKAVYVDTSATEVGNNFIALSVNTHTPVVGDTLLLGEITGTGLERAIATTITHIDDTNVTTLAETFTATGTHTAVQLSGIFNQGTVGGDMTHENTFTPANLISGDTLTVTWTLTLG